MSYLLEIRQRLIVFALFYATFFVVFFYWQEPLLKWFLAPLSSVLEKTDFLVATQIASPVLAPLHVASQAAFYCSFPVLWIQCWCFIKPALHLQERVWVKWLGAGSLLLAVCGMLFCFYAVLPFLFQLFSSMTPAEAHYFPELSAAVTFILKMLLLFAISFQLPLMMWLLTRVTPLTYDSFKVGRPYFIVFAFIIGMLLTPPDVVSQILLAVPLCLLYELGLLMSLKLG